MVIDGLQAGVHGVDRQVLWPRHPFELEPRCSILRFAAVMVAGGWRELSAVRGICRDGIGSGSFQ